MEARRRKERTYPELMGRNRRARLVVLGVEVGGPAVARDATLCFSVGPSQGKRRDQLDAETCRAGLPSQVGLHVGLCGGKDCGIHDA